MYFLVLILGSLSFGHAFEELFFVLLFAVELAKTDRTPALSQWDPGSRPPRTHSVASPGARFRSSGRPSRMGSAESPVSMCWTRRGLRSQTGLDWSLPKPNRSSTGHLILTDLRLFTWGRVPSRGLSLAAGRGRGRSVGPPHSAWQGAQETVPPLSPFCLHSIRQTIGHTS